MTLNFQDSLYRQPSLTRNKWSYLCVEALKVVKTAKCHQNVHISVPRGRSPAAARHIPPRTKHCLARSSCSCSWDLALSGLNLYRAWFRYIINKINQTRPSNRSTVDLSVLIYINLYINQAAASTGQYATRARSSCTSPPPGPGGAWGGAGVRVHG